MDAADLQRRARSFGAVADEYERARPGYPAAAIEWMLEVAPGRRAIDLAAGTGKLTRALLAAGARVTAVEPDPGMLETLVAVLPDEVTAVSGIAEAIPLPDASADLVAVGQAFHWFDAPRALDEIARVLVPGGVVALVWNARDDSVGWVDELSGAVGGGQDTISIPFDEDEEPLAVHPAFGRLERRSFAHTEEFDADRLVRWAVSTSGVSTLPPPERERVLAAVAELAANHPDLRGRSTFDLPYHARVARAVRN
jgi:SAM-dependent methyltransferase